MVDLTQSAKTKSEKIRILGAAGYSRRDIADFLGIRYQFVRNVLVDEERKRKGFMGGVAEPTLAWRSEEKRSPLPGKIRVRTDGSAVLPAVLLSAAGFKGDDVLVARVANDGGIHLLSSRTAIRRAQDLIRQFVPENVSLVEELLQARRREAENE